MAVVYREGSVINMREEEKTISEEMKGKESMKERKNKEKTKKNGE